jgi:hypothetical protein
MMSARRGSRCPKHPADGRDCIPRKTLQPLGIIDATCGWCMANNSAGTDPQHRCARKLGEYTLLPRRLCYVRRMRGPQPPYNHEPCLLPETPCRIRSLCVARFAKAA